MLLFWICTFSKVPAAAKQPNGKFYRHLGQKSIQGMVKNMMQGASIEGKIFTNHSLRATGITSLFDAGVPETLVQKCSDHCSIKNVRKSYTRPRLCSLQGLTQHIKNIHEPTTHTQPAVEDGDRDSNASFSAQDLSICDSLC